LFGEGALTASYLPVVTRELGEDRRRGWKLASVTFVGLGGVLVGVVLLGELVFAGLAWCYRDSPSTCLLLGLSAVMFPYLIFICLAAQVSATLHALNCFSLPALVPTLLNVCWLAGVWFAAPLLSTNPQLQAYILAGSILLAGVLQLAVQIPELRKLGFRFDFDWPASQATVREIMRALAPMAIGLAVMQVNALGDSLIAWGLTGTDDGPGTIVWLGDLVQYPFRQGAIAAMYFGERLYQFPLGILGMAVATSIFPALSRHAAQKAYQQLGNDLSAGLRLVLFLGLPAGAGLWLLADPLATLFYQHGSRVTDFDMERVGRVVECYALGVWAFCATPVLIRGYYAMGNQHVPLRIALQTMAVNLAFNLVLIWPWAEAGLALSTSLAAIFQAIVLITNFKDVGIELAWPEIGRTAGHAILATAAMLLAGVVVLGILPEEEDLAIKLARVVVPLLVSVAVFAAIGRWLRAEEFAFLGWARKPAGAEGPG
jgi:putative peptidoglycan lipid II flippase